MARTGHEDREDRTDKTKERELERGDTISVVKKKKLTIRNDAREILGRGNKRGQLRRLNQVSEN